MKISSPSNFLPDYELLIQQSIEELRLKTAAHDATWHLGEAAWDVDQDAGEIVFTAPNGIAAVCPVQIIGTFNSLDNTFLWGWDHPSIEPPLRRHAEQVRAYGEQFNIEELITRKLSCSEQDAWKFTALACKLCDAQGAYRGPAGATFVFMTFGEVSLSKL
jgi:hypothetical protein